MDIEDKIIELAKEGYGRPHILDNVPGATEWQVRKVLEDYRNEETQDATVSPKPDGTIEVRVTGTGSIETLDDLLTHVDADKKEYSVKWWDANCWQQHFRVDDELIPKTNYQVKAKLERNTDVINNQIILEELKDFAEEHSPDYSPIDRDVVDEEEFTLVLDLYDLHIGMLAWGEETGEASYDSKIAVDMVRTATEKLLSRVTAFNVTKVIFPVGNDLLHTDQTIKGSGGATTRGTPQDVDTRYLQMFRTAFGLMVEVIDKLRVLAPVEVLVVPGNHDGERSQYLGEVLWAWYNKDDEVVIKNSANPRKYSTFGTTLLGFTHGSEEKTSNLPLIMASEQPKEWGATDYRIFFTGHTHRRRGSSTITTDTYNGVEVITIPSLVPPDAWHSQKGYVGGGRSAEVHLFGKDTGPAGVFIYNIPRKVSE